jgi:hypothetical protein
MAIERSLLGFWETLEKEYRMDESMEARKRELANDVSMKVV